MASTAADSNSPVHPEILWAERDDIIYFTVNQPDIHRVEVDVQPTTIKVVATSHGVNYECTLELFKKLEPGRFVDGETKSGDIKNVSQLDTGLTLELIKAEDSKGYWNRLGKEGLKYHFVRTDFSRWVDEDDGSSDDGGAMNMPF
ncbi:p23 chaperone protein wos2 [Mycoemilia scoparia]|uniref:P23 chaperone protein wos2 n=1 Tax=Mycoemilia scoparia TaxID=417184 RepID=A0A9W8DLM2_9FUNG|nr:p23 chaperone protein wos2 [Mycoemilia scoparia]